MYKKQNLLGFSLKPPPSISPIKPPHLQPQPPHPRQQSPSPPPRSNSASQITFLKTKLVDTHKKLLSELEKAKEHQKEIIQYGDEIGRLNQVLARKDGEIDELKKKERVKQKESQKDKERDKEKEREDNWLKNVDSGGKKEREHKVDSQRSKVYRSQDQISKLTAQVKQLKTQIAHLHKSLESKQQDNKQLSHRIQTLKKKYDISNTQHEEELRLIQSKANESRKLHFQLQTLEEQTSMYKQRMYQLETRCQGLESQNYQIRSQLQAHLRDRSYSSNRNRAVDQLKYENNRLSSLLEEKSRELESTRIKLKAMEPRDKRGFEETRRMIERLQEVEHLTRSRGTLKHDLSQSTLGKSKIRENSGKKERRRDKEREREITFYDEY